MGFCGWAFSGNDLVTEAATGLQPYPRKPAETMHSGCLWGMNQNVGSTRIPQRILARWMTRKEKQ